MNLQANFRQRVKVNSVIHIKRSLSGQGEIKAKVGMDVTPADILGSSQLSAGYFTVNVVKDLNTSLETAKKCLVRHDGERIFRGELLAKRRSLLGEKVVVSPADGIIQTYDEKKGELLLKYLPKNIPLTSGVFGIIDYVDPSSSYVLIRTTVTEVFGIFGCGYQRIGIINVLSNAGALTSKQQITENMSKQILVVGAFIYGETLRWAAQLGVAGIISGGLNARDFRAMSGSLDPAKRVGTDFGMSVVVTEGFGSMAIGEDIYTVLKNHHGKFGFIGGNSNRLLLPSSDPDSIIALRKIILPVNKEPEAFAKVSIKDVGVGDRVRIIWPPFAGWQGKVVGIDASSTRLPSGVSTYLVTIDTANRRIKVPFPNIEIVE